MKKILPYILVILGATSYGFSHYINAQVSDGLQQIKSAQKKVDSLDSALSYSPYTQPFGKSITGSAQEQIDAGQKKVDMYSKIAAELKAAGIALLILGFVSLIVSFFRKKTK